MRGNKPSVDPAMLEIIQREVREFTGKSPLRKGETGEQDALIDDLVSAGHEALLRAVDYFDPSRGFKIQTYASRCVRNAIRRAARPRKRDVLAGGYELAYLDSVTRTAEDGRLSLHDLIPDKPGTDLTDAAWRCLQRELPDRQFDVLLSRGAGYTRDEIGGRLGITAERVRQIEQQALKTVEKLRGVSSSLRLAIDAPRFYAEQMADARRKVAAYHSPNRASWWAYRDGRRFNAEWKSRGSQLYVPPRYLTDRDWHEALVAAAKLAAKDLGINITITTPKQEARTCASDRTTTSESQYLMTC